MQRMEVLNFIQVCIHKYHKHSTNNLDNFSAFQKGEITLTESGIVILREGVNQKSAIIKDISSKCQPTLLKI